MKKYLLLCLSLLAFALPTVAGTRTELSAKTPPFLLSLMDDTQHPQPSVPPPGPFPIPTNPPQPPPPAPAPPPADIFDNPYCGAAIQGPSLYTPYCPEWDTCPDYLCLATAYWNYAQCCAHWNTQACAAYQLLLSAYVNKCALAAEQVSDCMAATNNNGPYCRQNYKDKCATAKAEFEAAALTLATDYANNISVCGWVYMQQLLACGCIVC